MRVWTGQWLSALVIVAMALGGSAAVHADVPLASPESVGVSSAGIKAFQDAMRALVDEGKLAGVTSLVARHGKVVHFDAYGVKNLESKAPLTKDTIFRIASMTKPIAGVAMMMLWEEGKWTLDDPVAKHIPEFAGLKVKTPAGDVPQNRPMTMRQLMSHTAGFDTTGGYAGQDITDRTQPLQAMIDKLAKLPLAAQPGSDWRYGPSVDIQGYIVEKLSGQPLDVFLRTRIFEPLRMNDTGFWVDPAKQDRITNIHTYSPDKKIVTAPAQGNPTRKPVFFSGSGGLLSTTEDYFRFAQMLLNGGEANGTRFLKSSTVELMRTNVLEPGVNVDLYGPSSIQDGIGFGLDFAIVMDPTKAKLPDGKNSFYWGGAFGTWFWIDPTNDLIVVGMMQNQDGSRPDRGSPQVRPLSRKLVYSALVDSTPVPRFVDPDRRAKLATAFPEIDRLFRDYAAEARVPGAAWGVIVDGQLAHSGVTGYRDVPAKAPVTPDTVFRIASMTKSFTAIAILKLRDEGKLSLDDPAEKYVPEMKALVYPTSDSPRITIRHLLSHAEGFPEDNPWGDQQLANTDARLSEQIRAGIPFSNAPGIAYEYSNFGFAILGRIVANVADPSGSPRTAAYTKYIRDHVLQPLGMTSTTLEPADVPASRLAHGYRWEDAQWKNEPLLANGSFGSMGGMLTTLSDLGKYVGAFLAAWPPRDGAEGPPIRRASLREMQQVWRPAPASVSRSTSGLHLSSGGYGYGLRITQSCRFPTIVAHGGGLPGFGTQMRWLPEYGVGLIAFGNLTYTSWPRTFDAALEVLARTGGLQPRAIEPSPALTAARNSVAGLIVQWDDAVADRIAAQNLFLDQSKDRRRAAIAALRTQVGACTAGSGFDRVENALRGDWTMSCERGRLRVAITLAPTTPPTVQFLSVGPAPAPGTPPAGTCPQP